MHAGSFVLRVFISFLLVGILGKVSRVDLNTISVLQVRSVRVVFSADWLALGSLVDAAGPEAATVSLI